MREIKFRAWDKERNKMIVLSMFDIGFVLNNKDYIYMQYTGLKDSENVEIYEGDIISGVGEYVGQSNVFYGSGRYEPFSYLGTYDGTQFEIVGNIYENQELLK